jgi:hypothetical protein
MNTFFMHIKTIFINVVYKMEYRRYSIRVLGPKIGNNPFPHPPAGGAWRVVKYQPVTWGGGGEYEKEKKRGNLQIKRKKGKKIGIESNVEYIYIYYKQCRGSEIIFFPYLALALISNPNTACIITDIRLNRL